MAGRRERGVFGTIVLGLFIAFNLLCLWLFSSTLQLTSDRVHTVENGFDQNVAFFLGTGAGLIEIAIWLVGSIVLGVLVVLTRGKASDRQG